MTKQTSFIDDQEKEKVTLSTIEAWLDSQSSDEWAPEYLFLRGMGIRWQDAMLSTWLSLSRDDRGKLKTREDLARLMGVSRETTYQWESRRPQIREYAELLQVRRMRGSKLAEVDRKTFERAAGTAGSAADRKLFYQRAGVWDENPASDTPEAEVTIVLDGMRREG